MFLLNGDRQKCLSAVSKIRGRLDEFRCGPIVEHPLGKYHLAWFAVRPSDNLHVFRDGVVIGQLDLREASSLLPIHHDRELPGELPSLVIATRIRVSGPDVLIEPNGVANIYTGRESASDMQLLIADRHELRPARLPCGILATVGYLPANLTLFDDISRIPLLYARRLSGGTDSPLGRYPSVGFDDDAMVERLASLVGADSAADLDRRTPRTPRTHDPMTPRPLDPTNPRTHDPMTPRPLDPTCGESRDENAVLASEHVALTAGFDSRFVLGVLLRAGRKPVGVHLSSAENGMVGRLASNLGIELRIGEDPYLSARTYALLTDGQIYHRGGNYSRLRGLVPRDALYFTGLFADSIIKNAFSSTWKSTPAKSRMMENLIDRALLRFTPPTVTGLRTTVTRKELRSYLVEAVRYQSQYSDWSRKGLANWFYYINRGVRWSQAHLADLSFFCRPVFLLSDLEATARGIAGHWWGNLHNDRVRQLNASLLRGCRVPYLDGTGVSSQGGARGVGAKIGAEFGGRGVAYLQGRRRRSRTERTDEFVEAVESGGCIEELFSMDLSRLLESPAIGRTVKRAAITLAFVLEYLDAENPAPQGGGEGGV